MRRIDEIALESMVSVKTSKYLCDRSKRIITAIWAIFLRPDLNYFITRDRQSATLVAIKSKTDKVVFGLLSLGSLSMVITFACVGKTVVTEKYVGTSRAFPQRRFGASFKKLQKPMSVPDEVVTTAQIEPNLWKGRCTIHAFLNPI